MITKDMQDVLNKLIQVEHVSAYLYLSMAMYFERMNLSGMAHWLKLQHDEERGHAQKLMKFLVDRGGTVEMKAIQDQPVHFGTPLEAFQRVLAHEQFVTSSYKQAYETAAKENDLQSLVLFQQFLSEQVEEEAQAMVIIGRLKINNNNPAGILLIDQELGQRQS